MGEEHGLCNNRGDNYKNYCESGFIVFRTDGLGRRGRFLDGRTQTLGVLDESSSSNEEVSINGAKASKMTSSKSKVMFPEFSGLQCNMLPFEFGKKESLPERYHEYWSLIELCVGEDGGKEKGKIGFLTIDERDDLKAGESHRRGGLHCDSPGCYLPGIDGWMDGMRNYIVREMEKESGNDGADHRRADERSASAGADGRSSGGGVGSAVPGTIGVGSSSLGQRLFSLRPSRPPVSKEEAGLRVAATVERGPNETSFRRVLRNKYNTLINQGQRFIPWLEKELKETNFVQPNTFDEFAFDRGEGYCGILYHGWGIGMVMNSELLGGIYTASSVDDTAEFYNCTVDDPRLIGHLGDCDHLRDFCGPPRKLKAGELCWFTDRTPHESLPMPVEACSSTNHGVGKRQFFRLVTSEVSLWYQDHSTANPLCKVDGKKTMVIEGSKFKSRAGVVH